MPGMVHAFPSLQFGGYMRSEFSLMNPSVNDGQPVEESRLRDVRIVWAAVIAILLSVIGLCWYGYSYITGTATFLDRIPGLQEMADTMNDRLAAVDGKINEWAAEHAALTERM